RRPSAPSRIMYAAAPRARSFARTSSSSARGTVISGLRFEIANPLGGNEKSTDCAVAVIGDEPTAPPVEFCSAAARAPRFKDVPARPAVAQALRQMKVLLFRDGAEFAAVFGVMIVEQIARAKSRASREQQEREREQREDGESSSIASQ